MAFHTGKPAYRSNPSSAEVRESLAYLKALTDVLSGSAITQAELTAIHGSGISQADLIKLHAITASAGQINQIAFLPPGYLQRSKFSYVDADTITIGPGVYHHSGTTEQIVYWNSDLTFDSTDSGTQWYYIYIDDSAIVTAGTNLLTASELINSTTAPTWSNTKHGWYNGSDRCIFAYYVSSGSVIEFSHEGGDQVFLPWTGMPVASNDVTTAGVAFDPTMPAFAKRIRINLQANTVGSGTQAIRICKESTSVIYDSINVSNSNDDPQHSRSSIDVYLNSSSQIILDAQLYSTLITMYTIGWYFPTGM